MVQNKCCQKCPCYTANHDKVVQDKVKQSQWVVSHDKRYQQKQKCSC